MTYTTTPFSQRMKIDTRERVKVLRLYRQSANLTDSVRKVFHGLDEMTQKKIIQSIQGFMGRHNLYMAKRLDEYLKGFK